MSILKGLGWERCYKCVCVFISRDRRKKKKSEENPQTHVSDVPVKGIIVVYVDDLIVTGQTKIVDNFF